MAELTLLPNRQARLAGLTVGIISLKPEAGDPEVLLGVFDPQRQEPVSFRLRVGDSATVAGRTVRVRAIRPNPNGSVTLAADDEAADDGAADDEVPR